MTRATTETGKTITRSNCGRVGRGLLSRQAQMLARVEAVWTVVAP